jgi:TfoX/Sxy family transcriptional regulator of competence genes
MAHVPAELRKHVEAAAPLELELQFRPMFGGISVYAFGRMFMSLSDVGLALKLGGTDREELLAIEGSKPLRYEPDAPPSKSYVVVPERMLSDRKTLCAWIEKSASFVKASEPARGKARAKRT